MSCKKIVVDIIVTSIIYFLFCFFSNASMAIAFTVPTACLRCSTWHSGYKTLSYREHLAVLCLPPFYVFLIHVWFVCFSNFTVPPNVGICIFILLTIILLGLIVFVTTTLFKQHFVVFLSLVPIFISIFVGCLQIILYLFDPVSLSTLPLSTNFVAPR